MLVLEWSLACRTLVFLSLKRDPDTGWALCTTPFFRWHPYNDSGMKPRRIYVAGPNSAF